MSGRMSDAPSYAAPVAIGDVMVGGTVSRVDGDGSEGGPDDCAIEYRVPKALNPASRVYPKIKSRTGLSTRLTVAFPLESWQSKTSTFAGKLTSSVAASDPWPPPLS
jgi:hypothetical protein